MFSNGDSRGGEGDEVKGSRGDGETPEGGVGSAEGGMIRLRNDSIAEVNNLTLSLLLRIKTALNSFFTSKF